MPRHCAREIASIVKDETLDSEKLITGLCIVTKRMDTGSPWILANNPRGALLERRTCRRRHSKNRLFRQQRL